MCLAKVYLNHDASNTFVDSVTNLCQKGDTLKITTLFGEEKVVTGEIESIDFTDSVINIATK
jgi:predicted RNA-binding protein